MEARENPLNAAFGSRVSAASSVCAISAVAREIGAENAKEDCRLNRRDAENTEKKTKRFSPQRTQRKKRKKSDAIDRITISGG